MRHLLVLGLLLSSASAVLATPDLRQELAEKAARQGLPLEELLHEHGLNTQNEALNQYLATKHAGETIPAWLNQRINPAGVLRTRVGGDTAAEAVAIDALPFTDTGSTAEMANDIGPYDNTTVLCSWSGYYGATSTGNGPDVFYSLHLDEATYLEFDLCDSGYDSALGLFEDLEGTPGDLIAGNDDSCGTRSYFSCEIPEGDYFVVVDGYSTNSGDYSLIVQEIDDPCDTYSAELLSIDTVPGSVTGSTVDAPDVYDSGAGEVGITVTIPSDGNWDFSSCNTGTDFAADLYLFDSNPCDGGELLLSNTYWNGCDAPSGAAMITAVGLAAGEYHLMVSHTSTTEGAFEISVDPTPEAPTSGGPDEFGYAWYTSEDPEGPDFNWIEINGSGDIQGTLVDSLMDFNARGPIDIPFSFGFYGIEYTELWIGSNGLIGFDDSVTMDANQELPNPSSPNGLISGFWDDLDLGDGRGAVYTYDDTANDRFIVEYDGAPDYPGGTGAQNWFQYHLYSDGSIEVHYLDLQGDRTSCTVGMENEDGSIGLTALYNDEGFLLGNEMAIRFAQLVGDFAPPEMTHTPITSVETELAGDYPVTVDLVDETGIQRATVYWQLDGSTDVDSTALTLESGDTWTGSITHQDAGVVVSYWLTAWDNSPRENFSTSDSWTFEVVSYIWPPQFCAATDGELDHTWITWDLPAPAPEEGDYFESFESGIPTNWTIHDVDGAQYVWQQYEPVDTPGPYTGRFVAGVRYEVYNSPSDEWLVTQMLQPTADSRLEFAARCMYTSGSSGGDVVVATGNDLSSLQAGTVVASATTLTGGAWGVLEVDLSDYEGQEVYVAFHFTGSNYGIYLDDVRFFDLEVTPERSAHIPNPGCVTGVSPEDLVRDQGLSMSAAKQRIASWERQAAQRDTRNFQEYVVYRDDVELGRTTDLFFDDSAAQGSVTEVVYDYHVTALFDSGESDPSNTDEGSWSARPTEGTPDELGNNWINSAHPDGPEYEWIDISGTGTLVTLGDDAYTTEAVEMGIDFPFYGTSYSQVYISSNGFIGFDTTSMTSLSHQELPSETAPNNLIALFWDDLNPSGANVVYYESQPDENRFIVQYNGIEAYSGDVPMYFEAVLYSSGEIYINLQDLDENDVATATLGIENADGTVGLLANYDDAGGTLDDQTSYRFFQLEGDFAPPVIIHEALTSIETETTGPIVVNATITDLDSNVDHAELFYSTGAAYTEVSMTNTTGDTWTADIPHQEANTTVTYYLQATDDSDRENTRITDPMSFLVMSCEWAPQNVNASDGELGSVLITWDTPWGELRYGSDFHLSVQELMTTYRWSKEEALSAYQQMHSPQIDTASRSFIMYHVLRDGEEIGTTDVTAFTDGEATGLEGDVTYTYTVSAEYTACTSDPSDGDTGYASTPGGPDAFGYTWRSSNNPLGPIYEWVEISGMGTVVDLIDDGASDAINMGMDFPFYGMIYNTLYIGSNGFIGFAEESMTALTNQSLPTESAPNALIAGFWDDLDPGDGVGQILYYHDADNNRFIVEYDGVPDYPGEDGEQNWFQIILYHNGNILINHNEINGETISATVGIENELGTVGLMYNYNDSISPIANETAIMFYGPINCEPVECTGDNEIEPNDGWDGDTFTANPIESGDIICGTIQMDGNSANPDYFLYNHFGGGLVVQSEIADFDGVLRVLEATQGGAVLADMDDWERCGNESLGLSGLDNGQYFIVVDHDNTDDPIDGDQTYSLSILATGDPCDGHEPISCEGTPEVEPNEGWNSDPVSYNEISHDMTICGTIERDGGEEDSDWFRFVATGQTDVVLTAAIDEFDAVLFLTDFSPDGTVLAEEDFGPACYPEELVYQGLPAGEYYVVISCVDDTDFEAQNYSLHLALSSSSVGEPCGDLVQIGNLGDMYTAERDAPVLAHQDGSACPDAANALGLDELFEFTVTATANLQITMQGDGNADEVLYLMSNCAVPASCGAAQDAFGAGPEAEVLEVEGLPAGTYYVVADFAGAGETANYTITIDDLLGVGDDVVYDFELQGNHPNPFNPTTTIKWAQPELAEVRLVIWNLLGETVADLNLGSLRAGHHAFVWDASHLASGMYLYRLEAGADAAQSKLMLIK